MSAIAERYDYNCKHWSDIQDHLPLLKAAAVGNVMEIGVRAGMSTTALLAGLEEKGGHLWSVDLDDCSHRFKNHPQWTFIRSDSILESDYLKSQVPNDLQLLFVDGDHSYRGCMADLENFAPRAKRVFIHDCDCPDTFPGVRKAVEEYAAKHGRKCSFLAGSYGMGVIE